MDSVLFAGFVVLAVVGTLLVAAVTAPETRVAKPRDASDPDRPPDGLEAAVGETVQPEDASLGLRSPGREELR